MPNMTGGRFIAETVHGYGISHVFFVPYIAPRALMEMESLGIKRVQTHGEKAAAYMADGYARIRRGPGLCMAQSVGAVNLAAGLQDATLAASPVVAITGRQPQIRRHRNAYQEVDHAGPFGSVTKYDVLVDDIEQLPLFLRQAFREATTGTPGPVPPRPRGAGWPLRRHTGSGSRGVHRGALRPLAAVPVGTRAAAHPRSDPAAHRGGTARRGRWWRRHRLGCWRRTGGVRREARAAGSDLAERQGADPVRSPTGGGRMRAVLEGVRQPDGCRGRPGVLHRQSHGGGW